MMQVQSMMQVAMMQMVMMPVSWKDQRPALLKLAALVVLDTSVVLVLESVMMLGLLVQEWWTTDLEEECTVEVCTEGMALEGSPLQRRHRHLALSQRRCRDRKTCSSAQSPKLLCGQCQCPRQFQIPRQCQCRTPSQ